MEQNNFPVRIFSALAVAFSLFIGACNNHDTVESTTSDTTNIVTSADTTTPAMPNITDTAGTMGTTDNNVNNATGTTNSSGAARPNAAKKGMKGKVSFVMPAATKAKADEKPDATGVYANVDYIPSFPGGNAGLQKFFDSNIEYPTIARDQGVEGTVRIAFTVDENGKLMNPTVDGPAQGYGLDAEAIRVINKMPTWTPGKINGKPVKTKFILPVNFSLASE